MSQMLVVGSVAFDTIHSVHGSFCRVLGGSAVYASVAGSRFAPIRLVGVVGEDFPQSAKDLLTQHEVDLHGLQVAAGKTFHWEGKYAEDFSTRETLRTELNVFADFHPAIPEGFVDSPYVMLGNIDPELQLEVLERVAPPKMVVADTMNFWIEGKLQELKKLLTRVDVLVINEEEARQLTGIHNIFRVAKEILKMGPRIAVIKQGEYGALLFEGDEVFSAPAYPVHEVKDPTGAGDTFAGGLLGWLARRDKIDAATMKQAVIYGSALASFCVEGVGLEVLSTVRGSDLHERFAAFRKLAHFATADELDALRATL